MEYKDDIQSRMVSEMNKVSDKATMEGSFARDVISANSVEFENAKAEIALMIQAAYGTTAWGDYLTAIASEFGVDRKAATHAVGRVVVYGSAGSYVPKGTLFDTKDGSIQFATDTAVTIGASGSVEVSVTSVGTGAACNIAAHTIVHIPMSVPGVSRVDNPLGTHDGAAVEDDETLRARYLAYVREPATSGNAYHYKRWALAVPNVGEAKVIPLWNGPGTVKVLIIGPDRNRCSDEVVKNCKDYIESVRPIGATVTVVTPSYIPINIKATLKVRNTDNGYYAACQKALTEYFINKGFNEDNVVSVAQVGRIILNTGLIEDYSALTLNDKSANITISADQLPRLGKLELSAS